MDKITLTIRSREKVVFAGEVFAFTSVNEKGIFDVLPEHENFISVIRDVLVIHKEKSEDKEELKIERGILRVLQNRVSVYLVPQVLATPQAPQATAQ